MKSIHIFYLLFIFTIFIPSVISNTGNKQVHLYDLLQNSANRQDNSILSQNENDEDISSSKSNQQLNSNENENHIETRDDWDSGEEYYFQWAAQNRRPVEYFTGRKREIGKIVKPAGRRHIHDGIWRTGLVG